MSGRRGEPTYAFQPRAKAPKWQGSACSTGLGASSLFTPAGPNEAQTSLLSWRRLIGAMVPSSGSRSSRSCSSWITARSPPARRPANRSPSAPPGALAQRGRWLRVEGLPKYAPELNDIEAVWRDLKRHHLAHQTPSGPEDLDQAIHDAVRKLNTERSRHSLANRRIAA